MSLDAPWIWLSAVVAGWVFLGLLAGRFDAMRRRLVNPPPGGQRSTPVQR